jgi:hypothetical protein
VPAAPVVIGRIHVTTRPPGASISIAGRELGITPLDLSDKAGEPKTVHVTLDGFVPIDRQLIPTLAGDTVDIELKPARSAAEQGFLSVLVLPFAEVCIDGRPAGETPIRDRALKPGDHVVELSNPGLARRETRTVHLEAGRHARIQARWAD